MTPPAASPRASPGARGPHRGAAPGRRRTMSARPCVDAGTAASSSEPSSAASRGSRSGCPSRRRRLARWRRTSEPCRTGRRQLHRHAGGGAGARPLSASRAGRSAAASSAPTPSPSLRGSTSPPRRGACSAWPAKWPPSRACMPCRGRPTPRSPGGWPSIPCGRSVTPHGGLSSPQRSCGCATRSGLRHTCARSTCPGSTRSSSRATGPSSPSCSMPWLPGLLTSHALPAAISHDDTA